MTSKSTTFVMGTVYVVFQFLLLRTMYQNYTDLQLLANSHSIDTFWHYFTRTTSSEVRVRNREVLSNESVVILACGRNVAHVLSGFRKNLQSIVQLFKNYYIFLGESDSIDDTLMKLKSWQEQDSSIYLRSFGNLSVQYSANRIHRIALCRNELLGDVWRSKFLTQVRFLLVMDIDVNASPILTVANFLANFEYDTRDWAVMTASQTKHYYDVWAVRSHGLDYDCWKAVKYFKHQEIARNIFIHVHSKPIPRDFGLVPVRSAFGGFGVYQTRYLNGCYYEAFDEFNDEKCEHISFHDCILKNGGRIFINPKFQNAEGFIN